MPYKCKRVPVTCESPFHFWIGNNECMPDEIFYFSCEANVTRFKNKFRENRERLSVIFSTRYKIDRGVYLIADLKTYKEVEHFGFWARIGNVDYPSEDSVHYVIAPLSPKIKE